MKNVTDSFVSLGYWPSARSFKFNTNILATTLINLSAVLRVLIFFGKGVCVSCLFQELVGSNQLYFFLFFFLITRKDGVHDLTNPSSETNTFDVISHSKISICLLWIWIPGIDKPFLHLINQEDMILHYS